MTLKELKKYKLYPLMKACGYTDKQALDFVRDLIAVNVDECERFKPAPRTVDVPMGRVRK